jgi:NAD(P)-dependent dehydrogenase (short-subunit alcohol dehydrogenase family)
MVAAVRRVESEHGAVGVLVNNAGYAHQGPIEETTRAEMVRQFDTNVFGLLTLTRLVLPGMRAQGWGRVVNVGSMGGRFTFPGGGMYHATKHALEALTDALRLEVAAFGIGVVLVQPGPVRTAFGETAVASIEPAAGPYAQFRVELADRYRSAYADRSGTLVTSADDVARTIVGAVGARRPRPRYAVGALAKGLITMRRVLPDRVWDSFVRSQYPTPRQD